MNNNYVIGGSKPAGWSAGLLREDNFFSLSRGFGERQRFFLLGPRDSIACRDMPEFFVWNRSDMDFENDSLPLLYLRLLTLASVNEPGILEKALKAVFHAGEEEGREGFKEKMREMLGVDG